MNLVREVETKSKIRKINVIGVMKKWCMGALWYSQETGPEGGSAGYIGRDIWTEMLIDKDWGKREHFF